ncbi:HprK-related kinase A [Motilimonas pumila]|nr:HprK-related kinase A [Motilimonas pumila]
MLLVKEHSNSLLQCLRQEGIYLYLPPFIIRLRSQSHDLAQYLSLFYKDLSFCLDSQVVHFDIELKAESWWRQWLSPQVRFYQSQQAPFLAMPRHHSAILWEWGLNYCVAAKCHHYLTIHAAVVLKDGQAVVIPAPPGSGKSTLCALLCCHGWQLLSDEFALIDLDNQRVQAFPRPISLKNSSIDVLKQVVAKQQISAQFSAQFSGTSKGDIQLLALPKAVHADTRKTYPIKQIVYPHYLQQPGFNCRALSKAQSLMQLVENSFNFALLGQAGFDCLTTLVDNAQHWVLDYHDFNEALNQLELQHG